MKPLALIIRTAGTNCDRELAVAFEWAGARTQTFHLNRLIESPGLLETADLIGLPGGFSFGDDIAAGRILANRLRHRLSDPLKAAVARGTPLIGICNGFQVLVQMGLLPDPASMEVESSRVVTLGHNEGGRFVARWVSLQVPENSVCVWTRGLAKTFQLPVAHGEGRFVAASDEVLAQLRRNGQIALHYGPHVDGVGQPCGDGMVDDPNGSMSHIAGICDPSGLVLGLMPHPERSTHFTHHPRWTDRAAGLAQETPTGLRLFRNAVEYAVGQAAVLPPVGRQGW